MTFDNMKDRAYQQGASGGSMDYLGNMPWWKQEEIKSRYNDGLKTITPNLSPIYPSFDDSPVETWQEKRDREDRERYYSGLAAKEREKEERRRAALTPEERAEEDRIILLGQLNYKKIQNRQTAFMIGICCILGAYFINKAIEGQRIANKNAIVLQKYFEEDAAMNAQTKKYRDSVRGR